MGSSKPQKKKKKNTWPIWVFFITFAVSFSVSFLSETALATNISLPIAILILFCLIMLGIVFDILGVAVTSGDIIAYNAMASKRIRGSKEAIMLIKKASIISNICNDVIGDVCGIVSGAMGAAIVVTLVANVSGTEELIYGVIVSSVTAAMTVSGKAAGKTIAIKYSKNIVFFVGKILSIFSGSSRKSKSK